MVEAKSRILDKLRETFDTSCGSAKRGDRPRTASAASQKDPLLRGTEPETRKDCCDRRVELFRAEMWRPEKKRTKDRKEGSGPAKERNGLRTQDGREECGSQRSRREGTEEYEGCIVSCVVNDNLSGALRARCTPCYPSHMNEWI
jgi:hypothetical protein